MLLKDIQQDSTVIIRARNKIDSIEMETSIAGIKDDIVFLEAVRQDQYLINFESDAVVKDILIPQGGAIIQFRNVRIFNKDFQGRRLYIVSGRNNGILVNRRETRRYIINKDCIYTLGKHRKTEQTIIRDVSNLGFCVIAVGDSFVGESVTVSFRPDEYSEPIILHGEVVRMIVEEAGNRKLYGCKMARENRQLNNYIMQLQRAQLSLTRKN